MKFSEGTLLGGRVRYLQPVDGYRTGLEPVLLAAAVPARPGDVVLEAGAGAGAGLLCLAARVPDLRGVAVERDEGQAALARANFTSNGFGGLMVEQADLLAWQSALRFDHAFANPPWHDPAGTPSPSPCRAACKQGRTGLYAGWTAAMSLFLRPRGTLTLILPAASLSEGIAALDAAACRQVRAFPLWPKRQVPAKLLILQGVFQGRGACKILPGLTLHEGSGQFTAETQMVLRDAGCLPLLGVLKKSMSEASPQER